MSNLEQIGINGTDYDLADAYMREHGALQDGYYEGMSVGNADQLMSAMFLTEQEPFLFRTTGGALEVGNREYLELNGGSVAWNQLGRYGGRRGTKPCFGTPDAQTVSESDRSLTFDAANTNYWWDMPTGHKILLTADVTLAGNATSPMEVNFGGNIKSAGVTLVADTPAHIAVIGAQKGIAGGSSYNELYFYPAGTGGGNVGNCTIANLQLIDLTQMFGSTIADYIYTLESNTAGAGVAFFRKLFPQDYYAYDAGSLKHVNASAIKTTGFNQFDLTTGKAQLLGGHEYEIVGTYTTLSYSTGETITPVSGKFTPSANGELTVTGGNSTTCIHLVWDGERDGEYEEYVSHSYPLDSDLVLRGIPKLDASNNLYFDGDTYQSDGTVTRKYGIVDLGTLTWGAADANGTSSASSLPIKSDGYSNAIPAPMRSAKYETAYYYTNGAYMGGKDKSVAYGYTAGNKLYIRDSAFVGKTGTEIATALSGVYLVYELATPTTESADAFTSPMICDNWGTEEFTVTAQNGVEMPVGHSTKYPPDLKAKLEVAPESPDADGLYLMKRENGQNSYIEYISPLPSNPGSDGTYVLKATKSGSTVTLSWEEETA